MKNILFIAMAGVILSPIIIGTQCKETKKDEVRPQFISSSVVNSVINALTEKYGDTNKFRIERGVQQVASFWTEQDGSSTDFQNFCLQNFVNSQAELQKLFERLSTNFEILNGHLNKIRLELKKPIDEDVGEVLPIDHLFGAYDVSAHIAEDFFKNKIAFIVVLNFPSYSLKEKTELGVNWTRNAWAYARMGDVFTSRVPPELIQKSSEAQTKTDVYISEYNIFMGNLVDNENKTLFPQGLKLISHWGLRDELKANYSVGGDQPNGLEKQKMIYEVMKRIISQEIPEEMINKQEYQWNPYTNQLFKDGQEIKFKPEPNKRYQHLLNNFLARKAMDPYFPQYPTYISRNFEKEMEIPQKEVEELFIKFVSSPQVKKVAELISKRLGRKLEPFDIWYDGFKPRNIMSEDELNKIVNNRYKTLKDFADDMPNILVKLNFDKAMADFIASKISVDEARGAGHAWGAEMKDDVAHLRTRVEKHGIGYKGYNIACHELGHCVEQTITLHNVDYYMLRGVPNTAFTEALAFIFQKCDLQLLGTENPSPNIKHLMSLDNFWMNYEIMGVSLVDMNVWKWLYEHPQANAEELKNAVISIAKDIWNKYYADVFGIKDQIILAIYSHMIEHPLYLSAYPLGHVIEFQIEKHIENKNFAEEVVRIFTKGRIIPQEWMKTAVGNELSIQPILDAVDEALTSLLP